VQHARLAVESRQRGTEARRGGPDYQTREDSIRRCPLKKVTHGIMYELQEDLVIVYAVAHPKRQPGFGRSVEHRMRRTGRRWSPGVQAS
jgi:hypothetical protein